MKPYAAFGQNCYVKRTIHKHAQTSHHLSRLQKPVEAETCNRLLYLMAHLTTWRTVMSSGVMPFLCINYTWRWRQYFVSKRQWIYIGLNGVTSQKIGLTVTALCWSSSWGRQSGYRASLWDPWSDFILLFFLRLTITFFLSKAPSLTRKRVCSLQCNHSLVRLLTPNNHALPSHLRLCSLFVASHDSQGLRWKYSNPPPHGHHVENSKRSFISWRSYPYSLVLCASVAACLPVLQLSALSTFFPGRPRLPLASGIPI
jgi:hypothetical protein